MHAATSKLCVHHVKAAGNGHLPGVVTTTVLAQPPRKYASHTSGQGDTRHIEEGESDDSIDFLHFARQEAPDTVRKLEDQYESMMEQLK